METAGKHVDRESEVFQRLKGLKKHFCPDWDYMAIDETTSEFEACCCEQYNIPGISPKCARCSYPISVSDEHCSNCGYNGLP